MLSFDVRDNKIKIITGHMKSKLTSAVIEGYFEAAIADGGSLMNEGAPERNGAILRKVLDENDVKYKKCIISLMGTEMFSRRINLPSARPLQLKNMIMHSLNDIPLAKDFYVDYTIERERKTEGKKMLEILLYGVPKKLADAYYATVLAAGLNPVRMNTRQNCIYNFLDERSEINGKSIKDEAVLLLDVGSSLLGADLIVGAKDIFERVISVDRSSGPLDFSDEFNAFGMLTLNNASTSAENRLYLRIAEEAQKMVQFSFSRTFKAHVSQVYLYGENSSDKKLASYLAESLSLPASALSGITGLTFSKNYDGPSLSDIFGLAATFL